MSTDRPGGQDDRRDWRTHEDEDDDLGRAFGPDTASVPVRTTPQRVRSWSLLLAGVVVVGIVIVVALSMIVGSVQDGVGGVFPRPQAALDRFVTQARSIEYVTAATGDDPTKTSFASYDVTARVSADATIGPDAKTLLFDQLSAAAGATTGNGVTVWAVVDLGTADVGVSPSRERTEQRLAVARTLASTAGVQQVSCVWAAHDAGRSDDPADQRVTVETAPTGVDVEAVRTQVTDAVHRVFPAATIEVSAAKG
ncbi:hypothetical protein [Curtobacterium sp. VKM Ac-2922]|uniref:hypothetical protein n=1 Tax=Curtobacterium sp. VKM Ac-2922 TaxID=2929475 RepID=UPI001FB36C5C|nr:hypothetical protein [Curtobacterium sp. VKM Ac-2922]MCJ1713942.1 hypothetical protein [Curtobacterium sp. VKM Ac-2922]